MRSNQQTDVPLGHYKAIYEQSSAAEIAARTGLLFDEASGRFKMTLVGTQFYVTHPVFMVEEGEIEPYEEILLIRYLLEGKYAPASGEMLAYKDMPWGPVYLSQFHMRVIQRFAREFGGDPGRLKTALEATQGLKFEEFSSAADAAYKLEFLDGLYISILIWKGDDEFPGTAQVLFSDNFKYAFTAEDVAVVGDVLMWRLKKALKKV